jgi:hypothetical protein
VTILDFEFFSDDESSLHSIALVDDLLLSQGRRVTLSEEQVHDDIGVFANYLPGSIMYYQIPVGRFISAKVNCVVFTLGGTSKRRDGEAVSEAKATYRNVRLYERGNGNVSRPAAE